MKPPFKIDLTRRRSWRDDASNVAEWDAWDQAWRKRLGWRAGLRFWGKTNVPGSYTLISRHWPHRLCWSWSVWVGKRWEDYNGPPRFSLAIQRPYQFADLWLWNFYIRASWQDSDWMVAVGPTYKPDAPKIYWKHHLARAEPAGTA